MGGAEPVSVVWAGGGLLDADAGVAGAVFGGGWYSGRVKKTPQQQVGRYWLSEPGAVEMFRKAAEEFTKKATRSVEAARAVLVAEGIHTKSGKLTKNYR